MSKHTTQTPAITLHSACSIRYRTTGLIHNTTPIHTRQTNPSTMNTLATVAAAAAAAAANGTALHPDLAQLQAQSTGEDSNSSDTAASDHGDMDGLDHSLDNMQQRHFAGGFLGLAGMLPGPSGMHGSDFGECENGAVGGLSSS